ncbi:MAG: proline dehydrogenase family protein, partial [Fimbriimonadaceae bacterium]|nr:proline dehydrogenase family protein [Alphaproteobacteria bacterium]
MSGFASRQRIADYYFHDESDLVRSLAARARMTVAQNERVTQIAAELVDAARAGRRKFGGVDAFMHEYSLSSEEGVVLMCMAEALLRIPDEKTTDQLIADKIGGRDWQRHIGESDSLFVNASTWGLMLTGQVIDLGDLKQNPADTIGSKLKKLVNRSGEPVIRQAMRQSMRILGKQFVLGRNIKEAMDMSKKRQAEGYRFSYDMLGEAAMTAKDAVKYYAAYENALSALAKKAGPLKDGDIFARPSLSVKLSAIHPR